MNFNICKKALLLLLAVSFVLVGCSSGAPDDAIQQAITDNQNTLKYKLYILDDFKITNSYTRELGDETYYVYEYDANVHACDGCVGKIPQLKQTDVLQGSVSLVKRGDSWYF